VVSPDRAAGLNDHDPVVFHRDCYSFPRIQGKRDLRSQVLALGW
jgi:hypothetical protein